MAVGESLVQSHRYGVDKERPDVLLLSLHGTDRPGQSGLEREIPSLRSFAGGDDDRLLDEYLNLDADRGAASIARETAAYITKRARELRTDVVTVDVPLGYLDVDVLDTAKAARQVINPEYRQTAIELLKQFHTGVIAALDRHAASLANDGVVISFHTCAPHNRRQQVPERYGSLAGYIASFTDTTQQGIGRYIDLVTALPNGERLADMRLTGSVSKALGDAGLRYEMNRPFSLQPGTWQERIFREHNGLAIDLPKDRVLDGASKQITRGLASAPLNSGKIEGLGTLFGRAVLDCLGR